MPKQVRVTKEPSAMHPRHGVHKDGIFEVLDAQFGCPSVWVKAASGEKVQLKADEYTWLGGGVDTGEIHRRSQLIADQEEMQKLRDEIAELKRPLDEESEIKLFDGNIYSVATLLSRSVDQIARDLKFNRVDPGHSPLYCDLQNALATLRRNSKLKRQSETETDRKEVNANE